MNARELAATQLAALAAAITASESPTSSATPSDASQDPVLLRAAIESQLKVQVAKENELLAAVLAWTEKTEAREKDAFREMGRCWNVYESTK